MYIGNSLNHAGILLKFRANVLDRMTGFSTLPVISNIHLYIIIHDGILLLSVAIRLYRRFRWASYGFQPLQVSQWVPDTTSMYATSDRQKNLIIVAIIIITMMMYNTKNIKRGRRGAVISTVVFAITIET